MVFLVTDSGRVLIIYDSIFLMQTPFHLHRCFEESSHSIVAVRKIPACCPCHAQYKLRRACLPSVTDGLAKPNVDNGIGSWRLPI
jgi:hypothetical protein